MTESLKNYGIRITTAAAIFAGSMLANPQPTRAETVVRKYGQCSETVGLEREGILLPRHNFEITATVDFAGTTIYSKKDLGFDERCLSKIDPKIIPALQLMIGSPYTDIALILTSLQISFQPLRSYYAITYSFINQMNLAHDLKDVNPRALATVLTHEGTHWKDYQGGLPIGTSTEACIESEVRAFGNEMRMWRYFYPNGESNPSSQLEVELNNMLTDWKANPWAFDQIVREAYREHCIK